MAPPETYTPPNQMNRFDSVAQMEGYERWDVEELADYFEDQGLGDYREVLMYHRIVSQNLHTWICILIQIRIMRLSVFFE